MSKYRQNPETRPLIKLGEKNSPSITLTGVVIVAIILTCAALVGAYVVGGIALGQSNHANGRIDNLETRVDPVITCKGTDTIRIQRNIIDRIGAGGPTPSDANAAIGLNRIITAQNSAVVILDKATGVEINRYMDEDFYGVTPVSQDRGVSDPVITYDHVSNRFIGVHWENNNFFTDAKLTINSPTAISGDYAAGQSSAFNWDGTVTLTGNVVAADPIGAETALTNAGAINGSIALIASAEFLVGSSTKCANALAAGAIGVIIYDTESLDAFVGGISGSPVIPAILVPGQTGLDILAQLAIPEPVEVTMTDVGVVVGGNAFSRMFLAVSKDSSPNTKDDFYHYILGEPGTSTYAGAFTDYEKIGYDNYAVYISSNDANAGFSQIQQHLVAYPKAELLAGTAPQSPLHLPVGNILLDHHRNMASDPLETNDFTKFMVPSVLRPPAANNRQVSVFAGVSRPGEVVITTITNILSTPVITDTTFTVPGWDDIPDRVVSVPQPSIDLTGLGFTAISLLDTVDGRFMYRGIIDKQSAWFVHHVSVQEKNEVRWYEFDISNPAVVTIKQQGIVRAPGTTSLIYPSIDVNTDGNMGLGFVMVGPDKYVTIGHTGRLTTDPAGSVRYPIVEQLEANAPYFASTFDFDFPFFLNRFQDYASVDLDPSDGKTFWYYSEYVEDDAAVIARDFVSEPWKTAIHSFCVNGETSSVARTPQVMDPIAPAPAVRSAAINRKSATKGKRRHGSFNAPHNIPLTGMNQNMSPEKIANITAAMKAMSHKHALETRNMPAKHRSSKSSHEIF